VLPITGAWLDLQQARILITMDELVQDCSIRVNGNMALNKAKWCIKIHVTNPN
jgi:hypothetical protein